MGGQPRDPLDLPPRVGFGVLGGFVGTVGGVGFASGAEVYAPCEFADDGEVGALADFGFEWGAFGQRGRGEEAGAQVAECA